MKLGFGLYRHQLNKEHYRFARQCGATHVVVHLVDYFRGGGVSNSRIDQPTGTETEAWGDAGDPNRLWDLELLTAIKTQIESEGLIWGAIENFDPAHWSDVLLGGPRRDEQLANLRTDRKSVV